MPLISTTQFLQLTDRLSAIYDLFLNLQSTVTNATALPPSGNGPLTTTVISEPPGGTYAGADPDVALMTQAAMLADSAVLAQSIYQNLGELENFQAAIQNHFQRMGVVGLVDGYITESNIRIHRNYALMESIRTGNYLSAANVFRPDVVTLGSFQLANSPLNALFTPGTALGTGSGSFSSTNFAAQKLRALITPAGGGNLQANLGFDLILLSSTGSSVIVGGLNFTAGATPNSYIPIGTDNYYAVTGASLVSGGTLGDVITIQQVPERVVTL